MTEPKKLTTAEILALARQKKAGGSEGSASVGQPGGASNESQAVTGTPTQAAETPEASQPSESQGAIAEPAAPARPKTTAEILAAARAAKGTTPKAPAVLAEPVAPTEPTPAAAPKSTSDILAAARATGSGTGAVAGSGSAAAGRGTASKPKSTADILAAARAAKAGGADSASPAPAPKPAGSTADILAAARAAKGATAAASSAKPAAPKDEATVAAKPTGEVTKPRLPAKPPVPARAAKGSTRRHWMASLLTPFSAGWALLAMWGGIGSLGIARFMMPNSVLNLSSRFKVGSIGDFAPGSVSEKFKASRGVWIVRTDSYDGRDVIYALSTDCTHLGCTPNWLDAEQKYKCPCHGSGFYINGINFEGPAPRPLERMGLRVAEDGQLEVDKSVKFQEELGQWNDEKSFVPVV